MLKKTVAIGCVTLILALACGSGPDSPDDAIDAGQDAVEDTGIDSGDKDTFELDSIDDPDIAQIDAFGDVPSDGDVADLPYTVNPDFFQFGPIPTDCVSGARCEVAFTIDAEPDNPFDPGEIMVDVEISDVTQGDSFTRPAFYYQGFVDNDGAPGQQYGTPEWRVRFRPDTAGAWTVTVLTTTADDRISSNQVEIEVLSRPLESPWHGQIVRHDTDRRYLIFEDGAPFFPVGENMCWWNADVTDYTGLGDEPGWMRKLADNGGNFIRLWMATWGFSPEWSYPEGSRLGDYSARQDRAWALDRVFERADELGLMVQLCMFSHGQFSTQNNPEWDANPYNVSHGGFLNDPRDFFTDPEAMRLTRNRLRYIVARWGAEPALMAWELFNEIDLTDIPEDASQFAVIQGEWHRTMAAWLKRIDAPYRHMVTSSISSFGTFWGLDEAVFSLDDIDFAQVHHYGNEVLRFNIVDEVPGLARSYARFDKPVFFAELGVHSAGPAETAAIDPSFIGLHDLIWAPVFGPSAGSGMTWWWDNYIDPNDQYYQFKALADFVAGIDWALEAFVTARPDTSDTTNLTAFALYGNTTALVWVKNTAEDYSTLTEAADPAFIEGATLDLSGLPDGNWNAQWFDTFGYTNHAPVEGTVDNTVTALPVPGFSHDIALRLSRTDRAR